MNRSFAPAIVAALSAMLVLVIGSQGAGAAKAGSPVGSAPRVLLFSSDGMRPDLMNRYISEGVMPTYAQLIADGVQGDNGMTQGFPPNTGVGWYTMATGTWPSEHGSTNNTFHRTGDTFSNRTSFASSATLQADTLANAAERAGDKVAQVDWVGGLNAKIKGPSVDFASFFSRAGVLVAQSDPSESAGAAAFNLSYQIASFADASGWTNVPTSFSTAKETQLTIPTQTPTPNASFPVNRLYNLYIYDSTNDTVLNYDHVLLTPAPSKNGADSVGDVTEGTWKNVKLNLSGPRNGQRAGFYLKLVRLAPDLSAFKLYFTSVARANASCGTAACTALFAPAQLQSGENPLEKKIAEEFPSWIAADFAPLEAGIVDEDTYVQQGRDFEIAFADTVMQYILGTLQPDTQLAMVGYPATDEFSHQFMGLVTPTDIDGDPNPCYDVTPKFNDVQCTGRGTAGRVAIREGYIRSVYQAADAKIALARSLLGGNPTTIAGSDHGFVPQWLAVNARRVLWENTVNGIRLQGSGENTASNCGAAPNPAPPAPQISSDLTKACWAGGTIQIYVNPTPPSGSPTYDQIRTGVINAFQNLTDPANPGKQVVAQIFTKEQLRNVDGSDSLHPNRSGDVVVALRPPYQSDAGTPGQAIALSHFFGQHGYLPNLVDLAHNVNMHATFVASGPGIEHSTTPVANVRAIDLAPTLAFLQGYPGPQNARGKILYGITTGGSSLREFDILDISDYHGQLVPLTERSDSLGPSFGIGGAAFLKPWFDVYRQEAQGPTLTLTAGDAVGATPPISSFFGDKPTIELMNKMGFDLNGLGNHDFDRGEQYLRNELIPLANFKYVSANILDSVTNDTPPEWSKSRVFDFGPFKVAVIGFSNPDITQLTKPGALGPFVVSDPLQAVNKRATQLGHRNGIAAIVAIGHMGATEGTTSAPVGPLADLADGVQGVDAVVGDHTNLQVSSLRSNGVLVTENLSKGIRFTRLRLVVDPATLKVVYKTADFHKPWNIGVTADPEIQARINELTAQLQPILGTVIGESTVEILRTDSCGNTNGRRCESKVGDVVADSMRKRYLTDFAMTNSGGLRNALTCPPSGGGDGFCPSFTPPPWKITRGQVLAVLPFGNVVSTLSLNGAELKSFLENGVSFFGNPALSDGRFPQVSGLCFTYSINAPAGTRVISAVRANSDGTCSATPVDLTAASTYTLAINDFMASGGDGYPNVAAKATTRDVMDQVLADHITVNTPISPSIQGRITCTGSGCPVPAP